MALVERLMGLNSDGSEPTEAPNVAKISVHTFFAFVSEQLVGAVTLAAVRTALSLSNTVDESGTSDEAEYDAFLALAPSTDQLGGLVFFIERSHSIFILAEKRYTGYATVANVRSKFNFPVITDKLTLGNSISTDNNFM